LTFNYQPIGIPTGRIGELLRPFITLDDRVLAQTEQYLDLILKWNSRINLMATRSPEEIVTRHFGESFFTAAHLVGHQHGPSVIDLGSGAGFPGLPLAMIASEAQVILIESNAKKAVFLSEVIRTLNLENVTVFNGRGEDYRGQADLVTMRAVEKFDASMPLASTLVEPRGRLALMIGKSQVQRAKELCPDLSLSWADPIGIPGGHSRVLLVGRYL
jgi:16S rRNA (guanine527-N7)-methyltransferase